MGRGRTLRLACIGCAACLVAACAGAPSRSTDDMRARTTASVPDNQSSVRSSGSNVAGLARTLIGTPYSYGGADPNGFDCSGLVYYAYSRNGIDVPRTSLDQFKVSRKIALEHANEGDLVFFQDQAKLSHVGIYLGDGMFVHAPASGRAVTVASLAAPYYQEHLIAVGRLLPN